MCAIWVKGYIWENDVPYLLWAASPQLLKGYGRIKGYGLKPLYRHNLGSTEAGREVTVTTGVLLFDASGILLCSVLF